MQRCNEFQRYRRKAAHAACLQVDGSKFGFLLSGTLAIEALGGSMTALARTGHAAGGMTSPASGEGLFAASVRVPVIPGSGQPALPGAGVLSSCCSQR